MNNLLDLDAACGDLDQGYLEKGVAVVGIFAHSFDFGLVSDAASGGKSSDVFSTPIGSVEVVESYLHSDPPKAEELSAALSVIELHLTDLEREVPGFGPIAATGAVIGVGACSRIARVEIGLVDQVISVDKQVISRAGVEEVFRALVTETRVDRLANPGLEAEFVLDIVGELCLMVEFMRHFAVEEIMVRQVANHG